ncbi:EpsG family protein [Flavobacterium sp. ACN6]|uniref:EpsG family protein n=1 Tax=Flavobacterium sp. ACN6 TaxID=1920426 RepID=UPI001553C0B1|nr:EpsG family protein [Flavobacterium sp. ACN6]
MTRIFPKIIAFLFLFIAGLRYETGVDWRIYTAMFESTPSIEEITDAYGRILIFSSPDYGYCLFISIIKYFNGSIQTVFFLISLVGYFFLYKSIVFFSQGKSTSLLLHFSLLFFILDMSGLRQGFALAVFFYSIKFVCERNFLKYLACIFFAASFHWSAYLLLPLYFVFRRRLSSISLIVFFCISLLIFFLKISWLGLIITKIVPLIGDFSIAARLVIYSNYNSANLERVLNANTIINVLFFIITFALLINYRKELEKKNNFFNIFFNIYIFQIFTFFCMYEFIEMADRLRLYFTISNLIILPSLVYLFYTRIDRIMVFTYVVVFAFFSCKPYILNLPTTIAYHPYQNYLIYQLFDLRSTGEERLNKHAEIHG